MSSFSSITCFEGRFGIGALEDSSNAYVVLQFQNVIENCPLEFDIESSSVAGPATTVTLQVSP
jgi:hypothetical protein